MSETKILRFGLLLDGLVLKNWQVRCIQSLIESPQIELCICLINEGGSSYKSEKLPLGFRFLERSSRKLNNFKSTSISKLIETVPQIAIKPIKKGIRNSFEQKDIEQLKSCNLDFMLRFGFGILSGEVLSIPKLGVWSFHHGNPEHFRGGPPAFWEIYHRTSTTGVILQKLNEELDAGEILYKARLKTTKHSYLNQLDRLFETAIPFPAYVCQNLLKSDAKLKTEVSKQLGPIYKVPNNLTVLRFYLQVYWAKVKFHFNQLLKAEFWNIGVGKWEENDKFSLSAISWAKANSANTYNADPFWTEDGKSILYERYDYTNHKGVIAQCKYSNGSFEEEAILLETEQHFSYPFCFKVGNKSYVMPENFVSKAIFLYEKVEGQFINPKKLLDGEWVDPTLFFKDGLFWLFCSPKENSNDQLYLFYADSLENTFVSHPLNPVKIDVCSSRPAGSLFIDKIGRLIRPAQNSSLTYGGSISLNEITILSKSNYEEKLVDEIYPDSNKPYSYGLHTINIHNDSVLIDGKLFKFNFYASFSQLKRKLSKLISTK